MNITLTEETTCRINRLAERLEIKPEMIAASLIDCFVGCELIEGFMPSNVFMDALSSSEEDFEVEVEILAGAFACYRTKNDKHLTELSKHIDLEGWGTAGEYLIHKIKKEVVPNALNNT